MIVPPWAVDRIAPPSHPATSTQTTVTAAGPPADAMALETPTGSRASAMTTSSTRPCSPSAATVSRSSSASASCGTTPMIVPAPARRAAAADSEPLLPAAPRMTTTGRSDAAAATTRCVSAGAPQTSMTDRASPAGRSSGSLAAMDRPNRIAWPSHGTCSDRASQRARPSVIASGVRLSETSVAISSPAVRPSGERGPASSTTPVSMPPEPVTGFCILPRVRMISSTAALILSGFPSCASCSCRKEAASRFSRRTLTLTSSGQIAGRGSSRQAAWGSTPAGSSTRCRPSGDPGALA